MELDVTGRFPTITPAGAPLVVADSAEYAASSAPWTINFPGEQEFGSVEWLMLAGRRRVAISLWLMFLSEPAGEDIRDTLR